MTVVLIVCVSFLFAGPGLRDAILRMMRLEHEIVKRRQAIDIGARNISQCVRTAARFAIEQRRELRQMKRELARIEAGNLELKEELAAICAKPRRKRWILEGSMRGMNGRYDFIVTSADPEKSFCRAGLGDWNISMWQEGRFVSVPGTSRDDAYRRARARWPEEAGFLIKDAVYGE